jgi:hypothetical protein
MGNQLSLLGFSGFLSPLAGSTKGEAWGLLVWFFFFLSSEKL